ncbi:MAG: FHA domain-containing protein [Methylacidiphilales bacterium]|nr:FHA domain-containing protein [Candidatus Methylacidiphilales bacterium]
MRAKLISGTEKWGFEQPRVTLGRSSRCDINVSDPSASRVHVQLRYDLLGRYMVMDCGSRNGTLLNNELILGPTLLKNDDVIRIGQQEFIFQGNTGLPESGTGKIGAKVEALEKFPMIMVAVRLREDSSALVREPLAYSNVFGQWFDAHEKSVVKHEGIFDSIDQRGFFAYWPTEEKIVRESMKQVLAFVKESRKTTARLVEELREAIPGAQSQPFLASGIGLHFGIGHGRRMSSGEAEYYLMCGEDVELAIDLSSKAIQNVDLVVCDEKTQSMLPDLSLATPFVMGVVGPRRQAMLLHKLKI